MSIAVVIPYFQREAGILRGCLQSVFAQTVDAELQVFVVDDQSPVPAEGELAGLAASQRAQITLLMRPNGGPAKARNTALEAIDPQQFSQVAFLDSDDRWEDFHLANALALLDGEAEFYFADFYQLANDRTVFEKSAENGKLDLSRHRKAPGSDNFFYEGSFVEQIITGNLIGTSTVVYNTRLLSALRFREDYFVAGEDYLFWLDIASATDRIAFSTRPCCRYGKGVNIYSASGWGSPNAIERIRDELRYLASTRGRFSLSAAGERIRRQKIDNLRKAFWRELRHRLLHGKRIAPGVAWETFGIVRSAR